MQTRGQRGQISSLDQERDDAGQFFVDVVFIYRALQVLLAAASTSPDPCADHAPHHLQMAITEVGQLFVDLDQAVKQSEGQTKERLVAIEHDEKRGPQSGRRRNRPGPSSKNMRRICLKVVFFIAFGKTLLVKFSVVVPKFGRYRVGRSVLRHPTFARRIRRRMACGPTTVPPFATGLALFRTRQSLVVRLVKATHLGVLVVIRPETFSIRKPRVASIWRNWVL